MSALLVKSRWWGEPRLVFGIMALSDIILYIVLNLVVERVTQKESGRVGVGDRESETPPAHTLMCMLHSIKLA